MFYRSLLWYKKRKGEWNNTVEAAEELRSQPNVCPEIPVWVLCGV